MPERDGDPNMLSVEDVAAELGVHRRTVYAYINAGRLPAVRIGKGWKVHRERLEAFKRGEGAAEAKK